MRRLPRSIPISREQGLDLARLLAHVRRFEDSQFVLRAVSPPLRLLRNLRLRFRHGRNSGRPTGSLRSRRTIAKLSSPSLPPRRRERCRARTTRRSGSSSRCTCWSRSSRWAISRWRRSWRPMLGSGGFLLIFAAVNAANARSAPHTNSRGWSSAAGAGACLTALGALVWQTSMTAPVKLWVLAAMLAVAVTIEGGYRLAQREIRLHEWPTHLSAPLAK